MEYGNRKQSLVSRGRCGAAQKLVSLHWKEIQILGGSLIFLALFYYVALWVLVDPSLGSWRLKEEDGGSCVSVGWLGCSEKEMGSCCCGGEKSWVLASGFL